MTKKVPTKRFQSVPESVYLTKQGELLDIAEVSTITKLIKRPQLLHLGITKGVYSTYSKMGTSLYIGKSSDIKDRVSSHINGYGGITGLAETFGSFTFIPVEDEAERDKLEKELIQTLKPRLNKQHVNYTKEQASDCGDGHWIDFVVTGLEKPEKEKTRTENRKGEFRVIGTTTTKTKYPVEVIYDMIYYCRKLRYPQKYVAECFGVTPKYLSGHLHGKSAVQPRTELPENYRPKKQIEPMEVTV
jgi:predicted GIY-YIG superfamily endonuclease